jgi:Trk-type K+ transport system membrane component
MNTFADLSVATKLLFTFNMWVGRLEVMSVLVLLHPSVLGSLLFRNRRG